jgi:hypothetical protein
MIKNFSFFQKYIFFLPVKNQVIKLQKQMGKYFLKYKKKVP